MSGTTYYYQVVAGYSTGKQSVLSNSANAVFPAPAPGKPLNFAATPGDGRVTLTWTAPPGPISKYQIAYSQSNTTQTFTIPAPAPTATSGTLDNVLGPYTVSGSSVNFTVLVTGLSNRTNYYFQVRAVNDAGTGPPADTVGATPDVADDALVVSSTFPATMIAGKSYTGTILMRNIGTAPWTTLAADNSQGYYLACADGKSPYTWGLGAVRFAETGPIVRNGTATFTFTLTAPAAPNTYPFLWRMDHQTVNFFGDATSGSVAVAVGVTVPDGGFETPSVAAQSGNFSQTLPANSPWTFTAGGGISGNGGTFTAGNPNTPEGVQVGLIQGGGTISQAIPGFQAGASYTLTVAAAQRGNGNASSQTVQVSMDGTILGTVTPTDTTYRDYSVSYTAPTSGSHTLTFTGLNPNGGDNTALIDNVRLTQNVQVSKADVTLTMTYDKSVLCAGGYDRGTQTYTYLVKETGARAGRGAGDPHVAVLTATVTNASGQPLAGKVVALTWTQPGLGQSDDAPLVSFSGTTNAQGQISTVAISGDVVGSVPITATCGQAQATLTLNYQAAQATWQYQDASGAWQAWSGDVTDLYTAADNSGPSYLRVQLTFNGSPVVGHGINWQVNQVLDKNGNTIQPDPSGTYFGYGHLSGAYSTTAQDGMALASFTFGYRFGQIQFEMDDTNVHISQNQSQPSFVNSIRPIDSSSGVIHSKAVSSSNDWIRYQKTHGPIDYYTWVSGSAGFSNPRGYPAPSGEEWDELLPETYSCLTSTLSAASFSESITGNRKQGKDKYGNSYQSGTYWISQAIGNDPASMAGSVGSHWRDMIWQYKSGAKPAKYGAAFDLVLTGVDVFTKYPATSDNMENAQIASQFHPYVTALRNAGIVCWHRWAEDSNAANAENEIHCIDPACLGTNSGSAATPPLLKDFLVGQIAGYVRGEAGSSSYSNDWARTFDQTHSLLQNRENKYNDIVNNHPGIVLSVAGPGN